MATTEVAKMVSQAWKNLTPEEKDEWEELARQDKARYEVEKTIYTGPWKVPAKKRSQKDPNAPKRPMSAFLSYSNSKRAEAKTENPNIGNAEVSRILAQMWKDAPESERKEHIDREYRLRQEYKTAIAAWRKSSDDEMQAARKEREDEAIRSLHKASPVKTAKDEGYPSPSIRDPHPDHAEAGHYPYHDYSEAGRHPYQYHPSLPMMHPSYSGMQQYPHPQYGYGGGEDGGTPHHMDPYALTHGANYYEKGTQPPPPTGDGYGAAARYPPGYGQHYSYGKAKGSVKRVVWLIFANTYLSTALISCIVSCPLDGTTPLETGSATYYGGGYGQEGYRGDQYYSGSAPPQPYAYGAY
jgi:HMG (high mobility group) box